MTQEITTQDPNAASTRRTLVRDAYEAVRPDTARIVVGDLLLIVVLLSTMTG